MNATARPILIVMLGILIGIRTAPAQTYDLSWFTIDGGGGMNSTGGTFSLSGTIGQPDAGAALTGGTFTLTGGFWPAAGGVCTLIGDMNLDGQRDGADVQLFVNCIIGVNGSNCGCADFDGSGTVTASDLSQFVSALLN